MTEKIYDFKVLAVYADYLIGARGYKIDKYSFEGKWLEHIGTLEDTKYARMARHKFTRRLMRAEITSFYELRDGAMLVIAKKGFFRKEKNEHVFRKVFCVPRGSKPLNVCFSNDGMAYFGEYFQNIDKTEVHVYGSDDGCKTWRVVYTFSEGNINHIHGLFFDPYTNRIWILTGDRENECIIGWTDDGFRSLHVELRGGQEYRSCQLFFYKEFVVYATDSQYIENEIQAIDRKTLRIKSLGKIQGSAIKGGQNGMFSYLSTTVEPSKVNNDRYSYIWVSCDGITWREIFKIKKDNWPSIFQYATMEFPHYSTSIDRLFFSARAVKMLDGKTTFAKI